MPAAGFELHSIAVEGSEPQRRAARRCAVRPSRPTRRAESARASLLALAAARRGARRRRLRRRRPAGLAALSLRVPLVLDRGRQPPRPSNRLLAPFARRVCLAFPLASRGGRRYVVTGRPVDPPFTDRVAAREALRGCRRRPDACSSSAARWARARVNLAALEAFRESPFHVLHICGSRDYAELASASRSRRLRPARVPRRASTSREALAAADLAVARCRRLGLRARRPRRCPRCSCPTPPRRATTRARTRRWLAAAGAAVVDRRQRARRRTARAAVDGVLAGGRAWRRWPTRRARWRDPTPRRAWPASSWERRGNERRRGTAAGCHFVGVGGAGMSAYARAARALGAVVSGSDAADERVPAGAARGGRARRHASDMTRRTSPRAKASRSSIRAPSAPTTSERSAAARARPARAHARRTARRAHGAAADDRRRRHPRQDDDQLDARRGAARSRA